MGSVALEQKKLFDSVDLLVGNVLSLGALASVLKMLGERHVQQSQLPQNDPMVGASMLKAFAWH